MTLPDNWHEMVGLYELHSDGELKGHRKGTQIHPEVDLQGIKLSEGQYPNVIQLDKTRFVVSVSPQYDRAVVDAIRSELGLPSGAALDTQRAEQAKAAREQALKAAAAKLKANIAPAAPAPAPADEAEAMDEAEPKGKK